MRRNIVRAAVALMPVLAFLFDIGVQLGAKWR
jgi:hypothetical protein